jgi:protease-4
MQDPQAPPPPPTAYPPFATPYASYGQGYAPPPKGRGWIWALVIIGIVVLGLVIFGVLISRAIKSAGLDTDSTSTGTFSTSSIAVIDIDGVILDAEKTDKQLRKFGDDDNVKAIILHINSPGGGAAASQEIYHEVMRIRQEKHKKIVASVESVGASGAYYIASACDRIYANPASVVGSVGVIIEWTNYGELLKWAKLKNVVISHGELKDAGDPTKELTPKEQAYFQSLVDDMYQQFVADVATGRHTTPDKIEPLATGQVWTGQQALPLGLIDQQGGYHVALMDTAKSVGITGEPHVVKPGKDKRGLIAMLNDNADDLIPSPTQMLNHAPGFYFLWK